MSTISRLVVENGITYSSVIPLKNGTWLELVSNCRYQREKKVYLSKEDWLLIRETSYTTLVEGKKPYLPIRLRHQNNPINPSLKDVGYLLEVEHRYHIHSISPGYTISLVKKKDLFEEMYKKYEELIIKEKDIEISSKLKKRLSEIKDEIKNLQLKIQMDPENSKIQTYYPLKKRNIIAYIMEKNEFIPIGYDKNNEVIVFKDNFGSKFSDIGLPERPELWVTKGVKIYKAI